MKSAWRRSLFTKPIVLLILLLLMLSSAACDEKKTQNLPQTDSEISVSASAEKPEDGSFSNPEEEKPVQTEENREDYIRGLAAQAARKLDSPGLSETDRVRVAYEYVIANTYFAKPIGLDSWRIRQSGDRIPNYVENRALSPLAFGIGSCEDYACALILLLEEMGFQARYVPGITISVQGAFVDHAWAAVELDGRWYHLDPQLEDNIMKNDRLCYRYFLKSDQTMLADHRWSRNLLQFAELSAPQRREIEQNYLLPECPADLPSPGARQLVQAPVPDYQRLLSQLEQERKDYEKSNGKLPPLTLNITPPVFGDEGYGPKDD